VDGVRVDSQRPVVTHAQIRDGADIVFEMSDTPQAWGSGTIAGDNSSDDVSEPVAKEAENEFRTEREDL
jgi:putative alpha-1,2-mannosidase